MKKLFGTAAALVLVLAMAFGLTACSSGYRITVAEGDEDLVVEIPKRAEAGETVTVTTVIVCDADLYVNVTGYPDLVTMVSDGVWEFVMPEEDVEVNVTVISNGLA